MCSSAGKRCSACLLCTSLFCTGANSWAAPARIHPAGKYVPETLIVALQELEEAYQEARRDPAFQVR